MGRHTLLIIPMTIFALLATVRAGDGPSKAPTAKQIQSDLKLKAELTTATTVHPQQAIGISLWLVNTSKTRSYRVVRIGDGSFWGWREPHVFYTAEIRQNDGTWVSLPPRRALRCGLHDPEWQDEVTRLEPGERIKLDKWSARPEYFFEFQQPGQVRLRVHYAYNRGQAAKGRPAKTVETGEMGRTPTFELVSEPISLKVVRPLELKVTVKKPLVADLEATLSDVFDVQLINRSKEPLKLDAPQYYRLHFQVDDKSKYPGWPPLIARQDAPAKTLVLAPGESVSILGNGRIEGTWIYPIEETVRIRARYGYYPTAERRNISGVLSDWVEVKVLPPSQPPNGD